MPRARLAYAALKGCPGAKVRKRVRSGIRERSDPYRARSRERTARACQRGVPQTMSELERALPLLNSHCGAIDALFIEEVGPFGRLVVAEVREKWLATGRRVRTSDIDD